jgi:hypothetical protein
MEMKEDYEEDPLLLHFFPLNIHPKLVSYIPSNPRRKLSSSSTWKRKFFETLSHPEKVPLLMPYSQCEKLSFSIQLMDSIQQAHLHHAVFFPSLTCKTQIQTSTSYDTS